MSHLSAPVAYKTPHIRSRHGREFVDNYEWMRDKDDQDTLDYLTAENAFTEQQTQHLKDFQETIFQEIKAKTKETDMSVPVRSGNWWYYGRIEQGQSYGTSCRMPAVPAENLDSWAPPEVDPEKPAQGEEVLLDLESLAEGHDFFSLGASSVSVDGNFLAYSVDYEGNERFTLRVKDLRSGKLLDDEIKGISYGASWVGADWIFYQRVDEAWRPYQVWRHKVGTDSSEDVLVYEEKDEHFWVGVSTSRSEKYLFIDVGSKITSESLYIDLDTDGAQAAPQVVLPRTPGLEYDVDHAHVDGKDYWVVLHNAHGVNSELGYHPVGSISSLEDVTTMIEHRDDVRLEGVSIFSDHMALGYRSGGLRRLAIMNYGVHESAPSLEESQQIHFTTFADTQWGSFEELQFDEELVSVGMGANPEWNTPVMRIGYNSYITPATIADIVLASGELLIRKQEEVPGGYNAQDYTAYRQWVTAQDGTQIPVSIMHRKDLDTTQPSPLLLYGYGSYESSEDPGFGITRLSLLDRGGIFAVAHIRGGGEMGRLWYENGKGLKKINTFTDFIDVADALSEQGLTSPEQLVALGGSAGGLLMGAIANMSPQSFAAIHAAVPFVDPLTSILMPDLPLTVTEWDEWGDPYHDSEVYDYMSTYAPYDNVSAQDYPAILATTSLNDTRVLYVEPAKWIAKLRDVAGGAGTNTPEQFLLKTEMVAGHGGASGRYEGWRQRAFEWAWMLDQMGIEPTDAVATEN